MGGRLWYAVNGIFTLCGMGSNTKTAIRKAYVLIQFLKVCYCAADRIMIYVFQSYTHTYVCVCILHTYTHKHTYMHMHSKVHASILNVQRFSYTTCGSSVQGSLRSPPHGCRVSKCIIRKYAYKLKINTCNNKSSEIQLNKALH